VAPHGGVEFAGDDDAGRRRLDLPDRRGLAGLAKVVGGGLLVLVGCPM
jgi:hypothetical protein